MDIKETFLKSLPALERLAIRGYGGGFPNEHSKRHYIDFLATAIASATDEEIEELKKLRR